VTKDRANRLESSKVNPISLLVLVVLFISFHMAKISYGEDLGKAVKFPTKPIAIMLPIIGGSSTREMMLITPFLEKKLGVKTIIRYVLGAEGLVMYNKFSQEKPDGHTISYFGSTSPISLELTRQNAKYSVEDFSPIGAWNIKSQMLITHTDNWETFSDFLNAAKQKGLSVASSGGTGEVQYRLMETALGTKFKWVPYAATNESLAAVAGKHVDALLTYTISAVPMIRAGKLKGLAIFSKNRDAFFPKVPTLKELGYERIPLLLTYGMFAAPPRTPKKNIAVLEKALSDVCADPKFNDLFKNMGNTVDFKSSSELEKIILENYEVLRKSKPVAQ
jgi:tripartite-type tricarboxylate transporter receptor subunit TctC